jgi:hypothetical protein
VKAQFPKDTLAYQRSRALAVARSMVGVPCKTVALAMRPVSMGQRAKPEECALWFYMMNHGMSEIGKKYGQLEPLPADVLDFVDHYYTEGAKQALRAMTYLMMVCIRESRHHNATSFESIKPGIIDASSAAVCEYLGNVPKGSEAAQNRFMLYSPKTDVPTFVAGLAYQFNNGSRAKGTTSYGGKAWGAVTECLLKFVRGETSAEVMVDTVWTLSHNNGAIFNKGCIYIEHSDERLKMVLDVQRSGQVPQLVLKRGDYGMYQYVNEDMAKRAGWLQAKFPASCTGDVDWIKVKALGAIGDYSHIIEEQKKKDPAYLAKMKAEQEEKAAKNKAANDAYLAKQKAISDAKIAANKAAADKKANNYEVAPGLWVEKFQPVRKAA